MGSVWLHDPGCKHKNMRNWFYHKASRYATVTQEAAMKRHSSSTIELSEGGFFSQKRPDVKLDCRRGTLWLTDGSGADRILHEGQTAAVRSGKTLCITALCDSAFCIEQPQRHSKLETISAFFSGIMNGRESSRRSVVPE